MTHKGPHDTVASDARSGAVAPREPARWRRMQEGRREAETRWKVFALLLLEAALLLAEAALTRR